MVSSSVSSSLKNSWPSCGNAHAPQQEPLQPATCHPACRQHAAHTLGPSACQIRDITFRQQTAIMMPSLICQYFPFRLGTYLEAIKWEDVLPAGCCGPGGEPLQRRWGLHFSWGLPAALQRASCMKVSEIASCVSWLCRATPCLRSVRNDHLSMGLQEGCLVFP